MKLKPYFDFNMLKDGAWLKSFKKSQSCSTFTFVKLIFRKKY